MDSFLRFLIPIDKLHRVQNAAARLVVMRGKFCHITPLHHQLHCLPVSFCINFKIQRSKPFVIFTITAEILKRSLTDISCEQTQRQRHEFIIYTTRQGLSNGGQFDNSIICLQIHSAITSWIHSYFDNVMTIFMISNRTDA